MKFSSPEEVVHIFKKIYSIDQGVSGSKYLEKLIENISTQLDIAYVLLGKPIPETPHIIRTDIAWANGALADNFEYDLKGTPCANVITGKRVCIHPSGVAAEFTEDLLLVQMKVEAYVGAPIILPNGELLGLLVLLDTKAFDNSSFLESAIELFSSRIGIEVAKEQANLKIEQLNEEVKKKVLEKEEVIKKTHESLLQQEKLAATGRLMAGIAHELRNPLNLVKNSSYIANEIWKELFEGLSTKYNINKHESSEGSELQNALEIIDKHSDRIQSILNFMLNVSDSDSKKEFELTTTIQESIQYVYHASLLKEKNVHLSVNKNLPKEFHLEFTSDFQSIFLNLIENSLYGMWQKYDKDKDFKPTLSIESHQKQRELNIHIRDNGIGINSESLPLLFEPFYTTKPGVEGTGIGLNIVKSILDKNNARINIESEEGEFTEVLLTFKLP